MCMPKIPELQGKKNKIGYSYHRGAISIINEGGTLPSHALNRDPKFQQTYDDYDYPTSNFLLNFAARRRQGSQG